MNKSPITIAIQTAIYTAIAGSALAFAPATFAAAAENAVAKPVAQTAPAEETKKADADEKITVTGSRLRRDSFTVATPLVTMDREAIGDTGLGEMAQILVENMPSLSYGTSNSTSQSSVSNTGITTVELRDLGTNRTLTLIDGRRVVSNSKSGNYVSMSTIPSGMVKSVEVITGGAGSTYGADAVSGVVNIITQTDKEGFDFKVRGGESVDGGAKEFTIDTSYGTAFADDRGYAFFSANYDKDYGLKYDSKDLYASPKTLDWDRWQGPAPNKVPFNLERYFRWRCWYDYGTGLSGDLLSHDFDAVNQIMDLGIPKTASSSGGIYRYTKANFPDMIEHERDVPDNFQTVFEYPERNLTVMYSATLTNSNHRGKVFMGHDATMEVGSGLTVTPDNSSTRYKQKIADGIINTSLPMFAYSPGSKDIDGVTSATAKYFAQKGLMYTYKEGKRVDPTHLHVADWLDCIRNGGEPRCNIEEGFEEAVACHMATQSYLEGRRVEWDPVKRKIV